MVESDVRYCPSVWCSGTVRCAVLSSRMAGQGFFYVMRMAPGGAGTLPYLPTPRARSPYQYHIAFLPTQRALSPYLTWPIS
eukprot:3941428-Rhodomonas_salina.1